MARTPKTSRRKGERKAPEKKDPNIYVKAIEFGFGPIPARPMFTKTFKQFTPKYKIMVKALIADIKASWR